MPYREYAAFVDLRQCLNIVHDAAGRKRPHANFTPISCRIVARVHRGQAAGKAIVGILGYVVIAERGNGISAIDDFLNRP